MSDSRHNSAELFAIGITNVTPFRAGRIIADDAIPHSCGTALSGIIERWT